MINPKDVIIMRIPYPTINEGLAVKPHMYICRSQSDKNYKYFKCQTLKPYMLIDNPMTYFHDEEADLNRNPFKRKTR